MMNTRIFDIHFCVYYYYSISQNSLRQIFPIGTVRYAEGL